jgi:phosphate transport system substrate-binding protein
MKKLAGVLAAGTVLLAGCSNAGGGGGGGAATGAPHVDCGKASGSLQAQGSTFGLNIEKQWISDVQAACSGATINYTGTGSGAGVQAFTNGQVDFAGSDVPLGGAQQTAADKRCTGLKAGSTATSIPVSLGAVVFVYNLPGVSHLRLSAPTLAKIFLGKITHWNDPAIVAENTGTKLPSTAVQSVHRTEGAGTTPVVTDYFASLAGKDWTMGATASPDWPAGQAVDGSGTAVTMVSHTPGAIAWTEKSFVPKNATVVSAANKSGVFEAPDAAAVNATVKAAAVESGGNGVRMHITAAKTPAAGYPLVTPTYAITCTAGNKNASLLRSYLGYALGRGQRDAALLGYAALPADVAKQASADAAKLK